MLRLRAGISRGRSAWAFAVRTITFGLWSLRCASFGLAPALAFSARLFGALLAARFGAQIGPAMLAVGSCRAVAIALRLVRSRPGFRVGWAGAVALRTGCFAALRSAGLTVAGGTKIIWSEFSVAIAVEFAERVGGAVEFLGIDRAVVIRIECAEQSRGRALSTGEAFGAWAGFPAWAAVTLGSIWRTRGGIVLGAEGPRGQRESHSGGENFSGFHRRYLQGLRLSFRAVGSIDKRREREMLCASLIFFLGGRGLLYCAED